MLVLHLSRSFLCPRGKKMLLFGVKSECHPLTDEDEEDSKWDNVPIRLEELLRLKSRDNIVELVLKLLCHVLVVHHCLNIKRQKVVKCCLRWYVHDTFHVNLLLNRRYSKRKGFERLFIEREDTSAILKKFNGNSTVGWRHNIGV